MKWELFTLVLFSITGKDVFTDKSMSLYCNELQILKYKAEHQGKLQKLNCLKYRPKSSRNAGDISHDVIRKSDHGRHFDKATHFSGCIA